jgi:hypothetical protein
MLNALAIALAMYFTVAAVRTGRVISEEAAILSEFQQPGGLRVLVWLFPAGPLLLLMGPALMPSLVAIVLSLLCFLPAFVTARKSVAILERSGTDRVKRLQDSFAGVVGNGIAGMAFTAAVLVLGLATRVYDPSF